MTHILIPVTEALEEAIRIGNWEYLSKIVFEGKQVSLDVDHIVINEAYVEYCQSNPSHRVVIKHFSDAYILALKHLS